MGAAKLGWICGMTYARAFYEADEGVMRRLEEGYRGESLLFRVFFHAGRKLKGAKLG